MPFRLIRRSVQRAGRLIPREARRLRGRSIALNPGGVMPWHSTGTREEVLVVLSGRLELRLGEDSDGRTVQLAAHHSVFLPRDTRHSLRNPARAIARYLYFTA